SQKNISSQEALIEGNPGHGCGHNLLGTGALAAAVAVQKQLQSSGLAGTVRYYGCPAEEGGGGKVFMARAGLYDDLDAALAWHPGGMNIASKGGTVAIVSSRFRFKGVAAHAGGAPELGRSALDAVELMNVGSNYLREHVLDGTRIQYIITDGGQATNIVPETAEVEYTLRTEKIKYLPEVAERLHKIAEGAALMTETSFEETVQMSYSSLQSNHYLADLLYEALQFIGPIDFTDEEVAFAQQINDAFPHSNEHYAQETVDYFKPSNEWTELILAHRDKPLLDENFPAMDAQMIHKGATDVGDLSQITPTGTIFTACFPTGSPGHSWANVACGGMSIGHKGMMHAAKAMALCAVDLLMIPEHLKKAKLEFEKQMGGRSYECPIDDAIKPPRLEVTSDSLKK
ncbi:MAG: amidohydrolase, partial [Chloroflexota bacterium]